MGSADPTPASSARGLFSDAADGVRSGGCDPFERRQAADVVDKVLQADLEARPDDPNGANEPAARRGLLRDEHMLDAGADAALRPVRRRLRLRRWTAARAAHADAAAKASRGKLQARNVPGLSRALLADCGCISG